MTLRVVQRARRKFSFLLFSARQQRVLARDELGAAPVNNRGAWWMCALNADESRHALHLRHVRATTEALATAGVDFVGLPSPATSRWSVCVPPDQLAAARRAIRDRWSDDAVYVDEPDHGPRLACALDDWGGPFAVYRRFRSDGGLALTGPELACRVGTWVDDDGDRRLVGLPRPYVGYVGGEDLEKVDVDAFGIRLPSVRLAEQLCVAEGRRLDVIIVTPAMLEDSVLGADLTRLAARAWWYHTPPGVRIRIVSDADAWIEPSFRETLLVAGTRSGKIGDGPRILRAFGNADGRLVVHAATGMLTGDLDRSRLFASPRLGRTFLSKRAVEALATGAAPLAEPIVSAHRHAVATGRSMARYPAQTPHVFDVHGWPQVEERCRRALEAMDDGFDMSLQSALLLPVWHEYLRGAAVNGRLRWRRLPASARAAGEILRTSTSARLECVTLAAGHGSGFSHEPEGAIRLLERSMPVRAPWERGG